MNALSIPDLRIGEPTRCGALAVYQHVGQHCAADYNLCIAQSDPAAPAAYKDLYEELERRGYNLSVHRRATPDMHERRRRIAAERRAAAPENQPRRRGGGHVLCERR